MTKRKEKKEADYDKPTSFYVLLGVTLAMTMFGMVMVFSSSQTTGLAEYNDSFYFLKKQILWLLIGFSAMIIVARVNHRWLRRFSYPAIIGSLVMLVAVLFIGRRAGGAQSWFSVGFFNVQPSEIVKLALVLFCADLLARRQDKIKDFWFMVIPIIPIVLIIGILIMLQPDMGTLFIIASTVFVILFVAGARFSHLFALAAGGAGVAYLMVIISPYRMQRIIDFWNPWKDPTGSGFQIIQSLIALGSGGVFGVGLGLSKQKFFYLPEAHTDFILAIIGEEFGLIGTLSIVIAFAVIAYVGIRIAIKAPTFYGRLLASGITSLIILQALVNMGAVTKVLPITGVTLPFISFGGTSLLLSLISMGILLNISAQEKEAGEGVIDARHHFRGRNRRPSVSGTRSRRRAKVS